MEEHGQEVGQPKIAQSQGVIDRLGRGLSAVAGRGSGSLRDLGITKGSTPERRWQVGHGASLGCSEHDDQVKRDPSIAMAAIPHGQGR